MAAAAAAVPTTAMDDCFPLFSLLFTIFPDRGKGYLF